MSDVALIMVRDYQNPGSKCSHIRFKGMDLKFYPQGINPETGAFEPVIVSRGHYNILTTRMLPGVLQVEEMGVQEALARIQKMAKEAAKKAAAEAKEEAEEVEETGEDGVVHRRPGRPRKNP